MPDIIFISYVSEDGHIAEKIAQGLEKYGYKTWYYLRDSPSGNYLENVAKALDECQSMVLIISPNSLNDPTQVNIEIVRAHEKRKKFQPVLVNVTWEELDEKQTKWRLVLADAIGVTWDETHEEKTIDDIRKPLPPPPVVPLINPSQTNVINNEKGIQQKFPPQPTTKADLFLANGYLNLEALEPTLRQPIAGLPQEVQLLGHDQIGTPHIFNVLLGISDGFTRETFASLGVDPLIIRTNLRNNIRSQRREVSERVPPLVKEAFSPNGLSALEIAMKTAEGEGRLLISEPDILVGLFSNKDSVLVRMLNQIDQIGEKIPSALKSAESQIVSGSGQDEIIAPHTFNLADETRQILTKALSEAFTSGYDTLETPHLISSVTLLPESKIAQGLVKQGINLDDIRKEMHELMPAVGKLNTRSQQLTWDVYSSRMQEVLMLAEVDAVKAGSAVIKEAQLVSGLSRAEESLTVMYMRLLGVDFDQLVADVAAMPDRVVPTNHEVDTKSPPTTQANMLSQSGQIPQSQVFQHPEARQVLLDALSLAFQYGYPRIETPFVVMALSLISDGCLARGLARQNLDVQSLLTVLRTVMKPAGQPRTFPEVDINNFNNDYLSPRVLNILKIAEEEARTKGVQATDCHLLIGFLKSQGGQTVAFMEQLRVNLPALLEFAMQDAD